MTTLTTILLLAAAGTWVGAILFQSAIVAPSVFTALDEAAARGFLRTLFPRFFRLGLACSGLSLAGAVVAGVSAGWPPGAVTVAMLAAAMTLLAVIALAMIPSINAARDAGDTGARRFATLHRLNVLATLGMLGLGISIIVMIGRAAA